MSIFHDGWKLGIELKNEVTIKSKEHVSSSKDFGSKNVTVRQKGINSTILYANHIISSLHAETILFDFS